MAPFILLSLSHSHPESSAWIQGDRTEQGTQGSCIG